MINGLEKEVLRSIQEAPKHSKELGQLDAKINACYKSADLIGKQASLLTEEAKLKLKVADLEATLNKGDSLMSTMLAEVKGRLSQEDFEALQVKLTQIKPTAGLE